MYKLNENSVTRLADGACIPFADGNTDYEAYKQWLGEGNTPEPQYTEEELQAIETSKAKAEALQYLADTDYITNKYNDEVTVLGTTSKTEFVAKYKEVYDKRAEARLIVSGGE